MHGQKGLNKKHTISHQRVIISRTSSNTMYSTARPSVCPAPRWPRWTDM